MCIFQFLFTFHPTCLILNVCCLPNTYYTYKIYKNARFLQLALCINIWKIIGFHMIGVLAMSTYSGSFVSMWLSSLSLLRCPCSRLAMLGETMGWGSALLRTVPVCQISSLHPALLGAAGPKLTTESTDKTAQNPVIPEKELRTHKHTYKFRQTHWHANTQSHGHVHVIHTDTCTQRKMDRPSAGSTPKTATIKPGRTQMCSDTGVGNALSCVKAQQLTQKCWCRAGVWGAGGRRV